MELDATAAIDANDAAVDALHDEVPVVDTTVTEEAGDNSSVGDEEVGKTENDPEVTTGDHPLDDSNKAPKQPVEDQELEQNEALSTETEEAADADTTHVDDVEMAELVPDPSAVSDPGNAPEEAGTGNDSDEKDEALEVSVVEIPATEQGGASEADNLPVPSPTDNSSTSTEAEAITDEQGTGNVEIAQANDAASPLPHDESEYDPSAPALMTVVPHGEDEYDPANPSPAGTPVGSNTTTGFANHHEQDEYDPDHPSMTAPATAEEPVPMEVEHTSPSTTENEQPTVTPVKRKAEDVANASSVAPTNGDSNPKRPRHVDDSKSSRLDEDNKQGRHRRGSGDSTSSTSSKQKQHEDHKGLSAAAWDRLMDFQTSGEFRVTQVSRAAFASVGAMPEFAQIAIIARFVRTPMKDVRDKNGQLMRIYREYQKENPQVAAVQPVDAFISDYKSDPGLFRFGYAPPLPATGMSNVQRVALQAVENFSNVDLAQVENLQGFLVGIINRVNEKAIASEKQQRPQQADLVQLSTIGLSKLLKIHETLDVGNQHHKDLNMADQYEDHLPWNHVHSLVANHTLSSLEELGGKCYEVLGQLSEPLANQVLSRFAGANLSNVRNKSGFLIGVVKRARQEYGFN
ncbi:Hypothetical protein PHPALM_11914 [Phytophthora palmivora]|uniref:Heterogeneous nuclear ribonucleoprotein Q acidic domain-containing protein n=1 Tax=Phytophthora palmivora TaxID=4796 RepID=A0A2P4Y136_9STRA|nr:Hypothetical protein PHPALM_11914 [Phytophthora palmivora]